eukprot:CAMPEP_0180769556 /NCGR_PEP_ID=MMETSP1038_2-20121128/41167_1 /TAXON_ID=632150 /ORGANISM="Azadinium spinosum, Strain 3D9" /LENGTH=480 /DNA_ID=CAMNT_0022804293 /DNA_START=107 /DNA_END=1545 /DNA_ORIENTATION=+
MTSTENESGSAHPVKYFHPIAEAMRAEVLINYEAQGDFSGSHLKLAKGDIVWVLEQHDSGWWGGHKDGDDLTGWFPAGLVRPTGDEENDEMSLEDASRSARPYPTVPDPLRTSDQRLVASPQRGNSRFLRAEEEGEQSHVAFGELQEELVVAQRRISEAVQGKASAEAEVAKVKQDAAQERHEWEKEKVRWGQEQELWQKSVQEFEAERQAHKQEVRRLHDELQRRGAKLSEKEDELRAQQVTHERELSELRELREYRERQEQSTGAAAALEVHRTAMHRAASVHSVAEDGKDGSREDEARSRAASRVASSSVSRRLFTNANGSCATAAGMGTPPPARAPSFTSMPPAITGSASMAMRCMAGQAHTTAQLPRPTPRGVSAHGPTTARMAATGGATTVGVPSSPGPTLRARGFAPHTAGTPEDSEKIEVRALVSAFERRSNSQDVPPSHRVAEPSANRQMLYTSAPAQVVRAPIGSSSRAG